MSTSEVSTRESDVALEETDVNEPMTPMESVLAAEERGEDVVAQAAAGIDDDPPPVRVARRSAVFVILYLSVFIDMSGTSIVVPVIPYLAREFNSTPAQLGLLYSGYALTQMIANVVGGRLSDRIGRRRVILVYLMGSAVGFLVQGFADSYVAYMLARLLTGLFAGSAPVVQAFVADITGRKERPRYLAMVGSVIGLAFLVGPGIGAGLAEFSLSAPMFVSSGVATFGFLLALYYIPDVRVNDGDDAAAADDTAAAAVVPVEGAEQVDAAVETGVTAEAVAADGAKEKETGDSDANAAFDAQVAAYASLIPTTIFAGFCNVGATTAFFTMYGIYMADRFGYTSRELGFTLSASAVVFITAQVLLFGFISRRFGKHAAGMTGTVTLGTSLVLLPFASTQGVIFFIVFLHSVGMALSSPAIPSLLSRYAPSKIQGRVLGYGQAAEAFSRVIMPPILGALYGSDDSLPFRFCAGLAFLSAITLAATLCRNLHIHAKEDNKEKEAEVSRTIAASWDNVGNDPALPPAAEVGASAEAVFGGAAADNDDDKAALAAGASTDEDESVRRGKSVAADAIARVPADIETRPLSTAEVAAAEAVKQAGVVDENAAYHVEVGHFLVTLLRKRGYHSIAANTRASKYALAAALSETFPKGTRRRASSIGARDGPLTDGPSLVFSPDMFSEEGSTPEAIVCGATF